MSPIITITLPALPPSLNNAYVNVRGRGRVATPALKDFKSSVYGYLCHTQPRPSIADDVRLSVCLTFYFGNKRSRTASDIDNRQKAAIDAVFGWMGINDKRIDELTARRGAFDGTERTEISIQEYTV